MSIQVHNQQFINLKAGDIVGCYYRRPFVRHAAIALLDGTHARARVSVSHMMPPLTSTKPMAVDLTGSCNLTDDERQAIERFARRHESQHRAFEMAACNVHEAYCIHPHAAPFNDASQRTIRTRFSCVGFVFEAYRRARIRLLDEESLPEVTLDVLKNTYPMHGERLQDPAFRVTMGLEGNGPWPVMLCGYLFHALNRNDADIRSTPYVPREADSCFP